MFRLAKGKRRTDERSVLRKPKGWLTATGLVAVAAVLIAGLATCGSPQEDDFTGGLTQASVQPITILNPYKNYPHFYKGQTHAHSRRSDGDLPPRSVLWEYGRPDFDDYDFVCLTDHDKRHRYVSDVRICTDCVDLPCSEIFHDPGVAGVTYIPSEEGGKTHRTHLVELGLTKQNPCRPSNDFNLPRRVKWVEMHGGLAVAAHPFNPDSHPWKETELLDTPWLRGVELKGPNFAQKWDELLGAERKRWGFAVDDSHTLIDIWRTKGWIQVNSPSADAADLVRNMRNGNFYAVRKGSGNCIFEPCPHFQRITTSASGVISVTYSGASRIRIYGSRGLLADWPVSESAQLAEIGYACNGSERYVRMELENPDGTIAYSQPLFVYGSSPEDSASLDYQRAQIYSLKGRTDEIEWIIGANGKKYLNFRQNWRAAEEALSIIKHYRMDQMHFIGRSVVASDHTGEKRKYFTVQGRAPYGPYPNEDCFYFDSNALRVEAVVPIGYQLSFWRIATPTATVLEFDDHEFMAHRALEMFKRHGFNRKCYVSRSLADPDGMIYFYYEPVCGSDQDCHPSKRCQLSADGGTRCVDPECIPNAQQHRGCGRCGTRVRTCDARGFWGNWGSCNGQGVCSPGATKSQSCGRCGTKNATCTSNCTWGSWSGCTGQGVCTPGAQKMCPGVPGRFQRCTNDCQWDPPSCAML